MGEAVAARFLSDRGGVVEGRNVRVGRGEVDLIVRFGTTRVAVEVKSRLDGPGEPADAFTPEKADQVWRLAGLLDPPAHRVDLVTVVLGRDGAVVRWMPSAG